MALKTFKAKTPSLRFKTSADFSELTPKKKQPKKPKRLFLSFGKSGGRNSAGRTTSFHRGGGHKRRYRVIDFVRNKLEVPAKVASLEYDPNRSAYIALLHYLDGDKRYILAPQNLKVGEMVSSSDSADIKPGNHLTIEAIPVGTLIHNIELEPGKGGQIARSAGGFAQLMAKEGDYYPIRMPSGELRKIHRKCKATVGQVSNPEHENMKIGKAGRVRWKGRRPVVRGVAMNPVDHPMGGGEGKASGGHPRSPWGQFAKGLKTRRNKRTSRFILKRRKK